MSQADEGAQTNQEKLRQFMEDRIKEGDPIMIALKGRGLSQMQAFVIWSDLDSEADDLFLPAIDSGMTVPAALELCRLKKCELGALLERGIR